MTDDQTWLLVDDVSCYIARPPSAALGQQPSVWPLTHFPIIHPSIRMLIFRVGSLLILFPPLHSQVVYQLDRVNAPATATFILFGLFFGWDCSFRCRLSRVTEVTNPTRKRKKKKPYSIFYLLSMEQVWGFCRDSNENKCRDYLNLPEDFQWKSERKKIIVCFSFLPGLAPNKNKKSYTTNNNLINKGHCGL